MFLDKVEKFEQQDKPEPATQSKPKPVTQSKPKPVIQNKPKIKQEKPFYDIRLEPRYFESDDWLSKAMNGIERYKSGVSNFVQGNIDPIINLLSYLPIKSFRQNNNNTDKSAARTAGNIIMETLLGGRILKGGGSLVNGSASVFGKGQTMAKLPKGLSALKPVTKIGSAGVEGAVGGAVTGHMFAPYESKNKAAAEGAVVGGVVGAGLGTLDQMMQAAGKTRYVKNLLKRNEQKSRTLEEEILNAKKQYGFDNNLSIQDNIEKRKTAFQEEMDNIEKETNALLEEIKNTNDNYYTFDRTQPTNIKNPKKKMMNDAIDDTPVDLDEVRTIIDDAINNTVETNPNLTVYPSFKRTKEKLPKKINKMIKNAARRKKKETGEDPTLSAVEYFLNNFNDAGGVPRQSFTHSIKNELAKYVYDNLGDEQEKALYAAMRTANRRNKAIYTDFPKDPPSDIKELEDQIKEMQASKAMRELDETQVSRGIQNLQTKIQENGKIKDSNARIRDALNGGRSYNEALSDQEKIKLNEDIRTKWAGKYYSVQALLNALGKQRK